MAWLSGSFALRADVFHLQTGGTVRGQWVLTEPMNEQEYVISTDAGVRLRVRRSQVREHIRENEHMTEYERIAPRCPDTAEAQWRLAEWCDERGLKTPRIRHLERVVELDPRHAAAWRALGYSEINGKWVTQDEHFRQRGYVFSRGRWRLPQEVEVYEEQQRQLRLEREWIGRLKSLRQQLGTERRRDAARTIASITDPFALYALGDALRREYSPEVRLLYVRALTGIQDPRAIQLLLYVAMSDRHPEVFYGCVDKLAKVQSPALVKSLVERLQDRNNVRLNRAAYILGRLGNRQAIPALVESLVTVQYYFLPGSGRTSVTMMAPLSPGPTPMAAPASSMSALPEPVAFATGGDGLIIPYQATNQGVLQALVSLSGGQSFGFDQRAWRNWWSVSQQATPTTPSLRGP
ncbi:MAG: HEAT repeat domain-containing protein [Pirellulaceae bacterium]